MDATECLRLWIANDEPTYTAHCAMAEAARPGEDIVVSDTYTVHREPENVLADTLRRHWTEEIPSGVENVWLDLLLHALADVDWRKLATDLLTP